MLTVVIITWHDLEIHIFTKADQDQNFIRGPDSAMSLAYIHRPFDFVSLTCVCKVLQDTSLGITALQFRPDVIVST